MPYRFSPLEGAYLGGEPCPERSEGAGLEPAREPALADGPMTAGPEARWASLLTNGRAQACSRVGAMNRAIIGYRPSAIS